MPRGTRGRHTGPHRIECFPQSSFAGVLELWSAMASRAARKLRIRAGSDAGSQNARLSGARIDAERRDSVTVLVSAVRLNVKRPRPEPQEGWFGHSRLASRSPTFTEPNMTITDTASNALTWINGTRRLNFPGQRAACGPTVYISARPDGLPKSAWPRVRIARRAVLVNQHRTESPLPPHVSVKAACPKDTYGPVWFFQAHQTGRP